MDMNNNNAQYYNNAPTANQRFNYNIKETLDRFLNKSSIVLGLLAVIIISLLVAYGLYIYIGTSIFKQNKIIIDGTKTPILGNAMSKIPITTYADSGNGRRKSYTFWIYINDLNKNSNNYKHVFHIGSMEDPVSAFPYVFLDKTENKLYVRFSNKSSVGLEDITTNIGNMTESTKNTYMRSGITIDYIPIQRWVHIAIVINENSNGGTIMSYVDAEYNKTVSTNDNMNGGKLRITDLDLDLKGDLYVGGDNDGDIIGFSGLLSKVTMYNYDINDKDIYDDYNTGPLDGFMARYLGAYGLRSPIYKIS